MEGTSRFVSEDEADDLIQASYAKTKMSKTKGLFYLICLVLIVVFVFLGPFLAGGGMNPLHLPLWPSLLIPLAIALVAASGGIYFNFVIAGQAMDDFERTSHLRRTQTRAVIVLAVSAVFMVLFLTITPVFSSSWLEKMVEDKAGSYEYEVSGYSTGDFTFKPNDVFEVAEGSIDIEVVGNATIDIFLGPHDKFSKIDKENVSEVEGASLVKGYKYNATKFNYSGQDFKTGEDYILRFYNYDTDNDAVAKIRIHREISGVLTWGLFLLSMLHMVVAGLSFGIMLGLKKVKVKRPAEPAQRTRARGAADMFKGMEEEMDDMFATRGGYRDGRVPPAPAGTAAGHPRGRGQQPGRGRPMPGRGPPRGRAPPRDMARRPPPRDAGLEVPAAGVKKAISCPRCRTRFSYIKREGEVTEIECPKCGKKGRVGAKAPPAPRPAPTPARAPPARAPSRPARAPTPASSPLEEVMGAGAPAGAAPERKKTLACPQCKRKFAVVERPRPFDIECPHCGKKGRLK